MNSEYLSVARHEDILFVAANMRRSDIEEIEAIRGEGCPKREVLESIYRVSRDTQVVKINDTIVAIIGCIPPTMLGRGIKLWIVGTEYLDHNSIWFLRKSKDVLDMLLFNYQIIEGYVYSKNYKAIKWLRWLGFLVSTPREYGPRRKLFCHYSKEPVI